MFNSHDLTTALAMAMIAISIVRLVMAAWAIHNIRKFRNA